MPAQINAQTFSKIILLALANEMGSEALSVGNWWFNGGREICFNGAVQYGSYVATQAVNNIVTPAILLPIFSNPKVAYDFIQSSTTLANQPEKLTFVALIFSAAGLITKTGDAPTNLAMGALLAGLVQYMNSSSGSIPFLYIVGNRRTRRLPFQQEFIVNFLIIGGILCLIVTVVGTLKAFKKLVGAYKGLVIKSFQFGESLGQRYLLSLERDLISLNTLNSLG